MRFLKEWLQKRGWNTDEMLVATGFTIVGLANAIFGAVCFDNDGMVIVGVVVLVIGWLTTDIQSKRKTDEAVIIDKE